MTTARLFTQACRLSGAGRGPGRFARPALVAWAVLLPLPAAAFLHGAAPQDEHGRALYEQHCAACHGMDLEGQPDWRSRDANGLYPAPPHDATGHTWHHDDAMLLDYITRGGQAVLDDMGVAFTSAMPAFGAVLDEAGIVAILDYIKATWPEDIRNLQAERSRAAAAD